MKMEMWKMKGSGSMVCNLVCAWAGRAIIKMHEDETICPIDMRIRFLNIVGGGIVAVVSSP